MLQSAPICPSNSLTLYLLWCSSFSRCGGQPGRRVPRFCPGRGPAHLQGVHRRPGLIHILVPGRLQLCHDHQGAASGGLAQVAGLTSPRSGSRIYPNKFKVDVCVPKNVHDHQGAADSGDKHCDSPDFDDSGDKHCDHLTLTSDTPVPLYFA